MVGNIIEPLNIASGGGSFDPDNYFDPSTHIATEANFIKLLEDGYYEKQLIGYKVNLPNSLVYNNWPYIIIDVNHDSQNTGQTNCYDLMSEYCFKYQIFGQSIDYRTSSVRDYLNNTYFPALDSSFKDHVLNIVYDYENSKYSDDKIVLPSYTEVNGKTTPNTEQFSIVEGTEYSCFPDISSRIKIQSGTSIARRWWTRSKYRQSGYNTLVWEVLASGNMAGESVSDGGTSSSPIFVSPIMRVR